MKPSLEQTVSAGEVGMDPRALGRIDEHMQAFVTAGGIPAIVTAVARHGKLVHTGGYGTPVKGSSVLVDAQTIFRLASMTKPIIGVLIMVLYEEGLLAPSDQIAWILPEFKATKFVDDGGKVHASRPITIKHLLTHTAGLPYFVSDDDTGKALRRQGLTGVHARLGNIDLAEYVSLLASHPLTADPGTQWRYSEGMAVLGRIAEVVTGKSLGEVLREKVLSPLGMRDTGFHVPKEDASRLCSLTVPEIAYLPDWPASNGGDFTEPASLETGSSGLVGTARDYLRFAQMLLNRGELDGVRFLSPLTVGLMMTNHLGPEFGEAPLTTLGALSEEDGIVGKGIGFGFTGSVVTDPVPTAGVWSKGDFSWGGGFGTHFWIDRENDFIALVMTQTPALAGKVHAKFHHLVRAAIAD